MADSNLSDLDPVYQPVVLAIVQACDAQIAPYTLKVIVTFRSAADQNAAKAAGLSNAGVGQGPHDCVDASGNPAARAFDFAVFTPDGGYITNGTDPNYAKCGQIAKSVGASMGCKQVYGGDWTVATDGWPADWDHIEMAAWRSA